MNLQPDIHFDYVMRDPRIGDAVRAAIVAWKSPTGRRHVLEALGEMSPSHRSYLEAALWYVDAGQNTFVVGPTMAELFEETSQRGIYWEDVKLPHACFYVAFPGSERELESRGERRRLSGIYVRSGIDELHFLVWAKGPVGCELVSDLAQAFSLARLRESDMDVVTAVDMGIANAAAEFAAISKTHRATTVHAVRLALSVCLYLQTLHCEVNRYEHGVLPKLARLRLERRDPRAALAAGRTSIVVLAPSVERGPGLQRGERGGNRRHCVRGHWHAYWIGHGDEKKRDLRWIKPYMRGSSAQGEIEKRLYACQGELRGGT